MQPIGVLNDDNDAVYKRKKKKNGKVQTVIFPSVLFIVSNEMNWSQL